MSFDHDNPYGALQRRWRANRMRAFAEVVRLSPSTRVLDVGGTPSIWAFAPVRPRLTLLNLAKECPWLLPAGAKYVSGDATALPFEDQSFDVVFSNSVIEHLATPEAQQRFARETQRVGTKFWVQTPNYWFPWEPHLLTPFIHWLPRPVQRRLLPFTILAVKARLSRAQLHEVFDELRLLRRSEFAALFPQATMRTERVLGLAKSFVAYRA